MRTKSADTPKCRLCGIPVEKPRLYYCCDEHRRSWHTQEQKKLYKKKRVYAERSKAKGRQCVHCLAFDHEAIFILTARCGSCDRVYQRNGLCDVCGRIQSSRFDGERMCYHCLPPFGAIAVTLVERRDGKGGPCRERKIYRSVTNGKVTINGMGRTVQAIPFVLTLPTNEWLKVRR